MYSQHEPYRRLAEGDELAIDRQWIALLQDVFSTITHEDLMRMNLSAQEATEFLALTLGIAIPTNDYASSSH